MAACSCCTQGATYGVFRLDEGIVDSNNLDIVVLDAVKEVSTGCAVDGVVAQYLRIAVDDSSYTAEAIDSDLRLSLALEAALGWRQTDLDRHTSRLYW